MNKAPPPATFFGPAPFGVEAPPSMTSGNQAGGPTEDHPIPSAPRFSKAEPTQFQPRTTPRVIEPVVPPDEDATISDLARNFVREWEESLARGTPLPPLPWDFSERDLNPYGNGDRAKSGAASTGAPPAFAPARRIMVVDDEPTITLMLQLALEQIGYTVATFTLPEQALIRFETTPNDFDLIITDYWMPKVNGLDLAAKIRARSPAVGIMLLSGYSVRLTPAQLQQLGISAFLGKPIEIAALAGVLDGYFATRK